MNSICMQFYHIINFLTYSVHNMLNNQSMPLCARFVANIRQNEFDSSNTMAQILTQISKLKALQPGAINPIQLSNKLSMWKKRLIQLKLQKKKESQEISCELRVCRKRVKLNLELEEKEAENKQRVAALPQSRLISKQVAQLQQRLEIERLDDRHLEEKFLAKQVLHYLYCNYKSNFAEQFLKRLPEEEQLELESSLKTLKEGLKIEQEILRNELGALEMWCYSHRAFLIKLKSPLLFNLAACEFINEINSFEGSEIWIPDQPITKSIVNLRRSLSKIELSEEQQSQLKKLTMLLLKSDNNKDQNQQDEKRKEIKISERFSLKLKIEGHPNSNFKKGAESLSLQKLKTFKLYTPQFSIPTVQKKLRSPNKQRVQIEKQSEKETIKLKSIAKRWKKRETGECHVRNINNIRDFLLKTNLYFIQAFQAIYQIPLESMLDRSIAFGIITLKNNVCKKNVKSADKLTIEQEKERMNQQINKKYCPTCSNDVKALSKNLPMLSSQRHCMVCRLNDSVMNDSGNQPYFLPSGQMYSYSGLQSRSKNGQYYCPLSNTWHLKSSIKRIFLS